MQATLQAALQEVLQARGHAVMQAAMLIAGQTQLLTWVQRTSKAVKLTLLTMQFRQEGPTQPALDAGQSTLMDYLTRACKQKGTVNRQVQGGNCIGVREMCTAE